MARATWTGQLQFGMVSIPVSLYTATEEANEVKFNQVHKECNTRIQQLRHCPTCDKTVAYEDLVKGYEIDKGKYVIVEPEELTALTANATQKVVDVLTFVDQDSIDPLYMDSSYYLGPNLGAEKPYSLLHQAMVSSGKYAVGKFVMRDKEHLFVIRPHGNGMSLTTLRWADRVRNVDDIIALKMPPADMINEKELAMAQTLVNVLSEEHGDFAIQNYKDEYKEKVMELIDAKSEGKAFASPAPAKAQDQTADLFAALEASIAAATAKARTEGQEKTA